MPWIVKHVAFPVETGYNHDALTDQINEFLRSEGKDWEPLQIICNWEDCHHVYFKTKTMTEEEFLNTVQTNL